MRTMVCTVAVGAALLAAAGGFAADPALKTQREKTSYALGIEVGSNLKRQGVDLDAALVAQGIRDALSGGTMLLTEAEVRDR